MSTNKVSVNICGNEYTIIGEKTPEHITKVAAHVNHKMQTILDVDKAGPISSAAVLSAINLADDYFSTLEELNQLKSTNEQLKNDNQHYLQLWEEAKSSFVTYKRDVQEEVDEIQDKKNQLTTLLGEKTRELEEILRNQKNIKKEFEKGSASAVEEVESKYKDLENNFFDLQMENIQLKSQMEKLKKRMD